MIGRLYESLCKGEMVIAKYSLAILSSLIFIAAVARTFYYPLNWAADIATFLFAWTVFLGADAAMRLDRLFCIEVVTCRLPWKAQVSLKVINHVIIVCFLLGMIVFGSWLSYTTRLRTFQGVPGFSYTWVTLSVPVGCLFMLITATLKIKAFVHAMKTGEPLRGPGGGGASGEII
jgi:TRAP-type C4-dicarboxylate transport system permease small subunit